jgi:DNA-binding PadR family transcriptional regulator
VRPTTYFILASLLDEQRHGYEIIKQAARLSGGGVRLAAGTLYGALDRLLKAGSVEVAGEEIVGGRARRYYSLTELGRRQLREEAERLGQASRAVLSPAIGGPA